MIYDKVITEMDPEVIREAVEGLGTDEVLAIETRLSPQDRAVMAQALGRGWRLMFRRTHGHIWMRSCESSLTAQITDRSLRYYVNMIESGKPFAFLRYGDMLSCVADTLYPGFGFQRFTPELKADMRRSLLEYHRDPRYIMALAPISHFKRIGLWGHVAHWLHDNGLDDIGWVGTETFSRAMLNGNLWPFIQALRNANTLIIGPPKLAPLTEAVLPDATFLPISPHECHAQTEEIIAEILAQPSPDVITFSAGPAAVVWIHRLWPIIGQHSTMISIGSLWGPFVGVAEHGGHRRITDETMQRNLGQ